jgi:hypothetical protein
VVGREARLSVFITSANSDFDFIIFSNSIWHQTKVFHVDLARVIINGFAFANPFNPSIKGAISLLWFHSKGALSNLNDKIYDGRITSFEGPV